MNLSKFSVLKHQKLYKRNVSSLDCNFPRPIIVALTGVNSRVGKALAFLLKQSRYVDILRVYDLKKGPCGIALDLSHINTNCKVQSYEGLNMLKAAVKNAHIVVVVGGEATKESQLQRDLFKANANYVHFIATHTSEFNPRGILCIETPPIAAMVPLASEEYKKAKVYDPKKIIGIASIGVKRSNAIISQFTKQDAPSIKCPIVGSVCRKSIVPVLSQAEIGQTPFDKTALDLLHTQIASAEGEVLKQRYLEDSGPCIASIAYSTAQTINGVAKGILNKFSGWDCGFIRQTGHIGKFLPYMASILTFGNEGVEHIRMPKLSKQECINLEKASKIIRQHIEMGESFVTGFRSSKQRRIIPCRASAPSCSLIKLRNVVGIGDVIFDSETNKV